MRDHIGYEAYTGSLRGARGTLWSLAGNALDRSSLLVALLRAAGFTAQYVQGTLRRAQAQSLILSMFQGRYRVLGCLPAGSITADPSNDPTLLGIAESHYWVQYGSGLSHLDTAFPTAQPSQVFGTPQGTFTVVPSNLQASVAFEVDAETYSQATASFTGNGISSTPVLNQTFNTSQLVGKPVTFGQFVSSNASSSVFSATSNTYSPYLLIGEDPTNPTNDDVITGTPFQELLTSFPLGSTILTGLFLQMTVTDASGNSTTYSKTLYDRIGYAARQSGGSAQITAAASGVPALSQFDLVTLNVLPSHQDDSIIRTWSTLSDTLQSQLTAIIPQLPTNPAATFTPAQQALQQQATDLSRELAVNTQRALTSAFSEASDNVTSGPYLAGYLQVKAYLDSPRIIAGSSAVAVGTGSAANTLQVAMDLVKDDAQALLAPGQTAGAAIGYRAARGAAEITLESQLLDQLAAAYSPAGAGGNVANVAVGAGDIITQAGVQGIGTTVIAASNLAQLSALSLLRRCESANCLRGKRRANCAYSQLGGHDQRNPPHRVVRIRYRRDADRHAGKRRTSIPYTICRSYRCLGRRDRHICKRSSIFSMGW